MRKAERGYSLAEMMVGLFAFSLILTSIVFLITRWQQTTSLTRIQRVLSTEAREAMRQIMEDIREASYIYHWAELDVTIASSEIPGHSAFDPYKVLTGYPPVPQEDDDAVPDGVRQILPPITTGVFAPAVIGNANFNTVTYKVGGRDVGEFGLGDTDLTKRLEGRPAEVGRTLALVSLSDGGLTRPKYIVYFAAKEPNEDDRRDGIYHVYRFQFQPSVDAQADTWYEMSKTFADVAQPATRSLIIRAEAGGLGTIKQVTGLGGTVNGNWQIKKLYSTINRAPTDARDQSRQFANGLFYIQQLHPWSDLSPISPQLVEVAVIPARKYGSRVMSFALFDRAYARNVAMPTTAAQ